MWKDPIVEEIRKHRDEYASKFNYDLKAMFQDLQEREQQSGRMVVTLPPKRYAKCIEETYRSDCAIVD